MVHVQLMLLNVMKLNLLSACCLLVYLIFISVHIAAFDVWPSTCDTFFHFTGCMPFLSF